jgi:hypothetical protein
MSRFKNARSFIDSAFKRIAYRRGALSTTVTVEPVPLRKTIRLRSWRDVASHQLGGCRTVDSSAATDTLPAITRPIVSDDERLVGGSATAQTCAAVLHKPVPAPEIEQEISRNSLICNGNKSHPPGVSTIDGGQAVPQQAAHLKFLQLLKLRHPFKGTTK